MCGIYKKIYKNGNIRYLAETTIDGARIHIISSSDIEIATNAYIDFINKHHNNFLREYDKFKQGAVNE